jgi:plastocyanin
MNKRGAVTVLVATGALVASVWAVSAFGGSTTSGATPQRVTVTMTEFKFAFRPRTVRKGTVVFTVVNRGSVAHDFKIAGKKTRKVAAGGRATLRVTFTRKGRFPYLCTLPSHAPAGMKGTLVVR